MNLLTWTHHSRFAVKMHPIPTRIRSRKRWPALRTTLLFHFQHMNRKKDPTSTKPMMLRAKMKHGQKPEFKSVVSGVGTVQVSKLASKQVNKQASKQVNKKNNRVSKHHTS